MFRRHLLNSVFWEDKTQIRFSYLSFSAEGFPFFRKCFPLAFKKKKSRYKCLYLKGSEESQAALLPSTLQLVVLLRCTGSVDLGRA